jgi:hypothetical protein
MAHPYPRKVCTTRLVDAGKASSNMYTKEKKTGSMKNCMREKKKFE